MFDNNLDAQAIVAGDRQCRLRADTDSRRLTRMIRGPRHHRVARPMPTQRPMPLRPCANEVLS